ncbi:MAG TPA: hypothetical protein VJ724_03285 [Tahibacter sp.]|nr:hypothetical protein [Tahibacter sp.]
MDRPHAPRTARNLFVASLALLPCLAAAEPVPDASFGDNGTVALTLPGVDDYMRARVVVLPDRRVVVMRLEIGNGGTIGNPIPPTASFARLLPDGRPDPAFGTDGIATFALGTELVGSAYPQQLAARADGSMRLLMSERTFEPEPATTRLVLFGVASDGRADPAFNGGQPLRMPVTGYSRFDLFDANGSPLVVAYPGPGCCGDAAPLAAWRFRADGTPDASFGTAGMLELSLPAMSVHDVMPVPGGGFQTLTETPAADGVRRFWRRYRANGSFDTGFGVNGEEDIAPIDGNIYTQVLPLGDGTWLATDPAACARRILDAQGRTLNASTGDCPVELQLTGVNVEAHAWGARLLVRGEQRSLFLPPPSDGAYLWSIDRDGRVDTGFAQPQVVRWRPASPPWPTNSDVAVDGDERFVLASMQVGSNVVHVQRFVDARRGTGDAQPVPALGVPALLLLAGGAAALARRRFVPH